MKLDKKLREKFFTRKETLNQAEAGTIVQWFNENYPVGSEVQVKASGTEFDTVTTSAANCIVRGTLPIIHTEAITGMVILFNLQPSKI